jgi:hypothetical protein
MGGHVAHIGGNRNAYITTTTTFHPFSEVPKIFFPLGSYVIMCFHVLLFSFLLAHASS